MKCTYFLWAWVVIGATAVWGGEVGVLSAEEEARGMVVPAGLRVEVVACEPLVEHPVAVAWDAKGRMWVAEMRGYMPDVNGTGEAKGVGRVSMLEDTDGDGRMDKSTVFLDGLVLPRAVGFAGDGVLIGTPTQLLFCRDMDGDGKCDEKKVIATDFGVVENPENSANGLVYGLDNWIYCACWGKRIRWKGEGEFEIQTVGVMGQWGMTRDDWGRLFFNTNSDYLRGALVPPHYSARNPKSPMGLADVRVGKDQAVWPTVEATVNRGYREGILKDGRLAAFTAACGLHVYRGELLPKEYYGNIFVCEATSGMIRRSVFKEAGVGLGAKNVYEGREFLTSGYERFRPVNVATGPEGALYVVDMHHGLIQHKMSLTEYAKEGYLKKGLEKHLLTGRIFRVVPEGGAKGVKVDLAGASSGELVKRLGDGNGWVRDTAQRLLVERKDEPVVGALKKAGGVGALWTLEGMGRLDAEVVRVAMKDGNERVRANGVRLAEEMGLWGDVMGMAGDPSAVVRLQVMLSLAGRVEGDAVVAGMLRDHGSDVATREGAVSGLAGREVEFLKVLIKEGVKGVVLTDVAKSVVKRDEGKDVTALVELMATVGDKERKALVEAVPAKSQDEFGGEKWIDVEKEPTVVGMMREAGDVKGAERVGGLFRWPGKVMPVRAKAKELTADEKELFAVGEKTYATLCGTCHQPDGRGQEGKAPPLLGSPWVLGPEARLVRIVLHGVRGPVRVGERTYNMEMPGLKVLSDEQVAGVLTYVRRSWGHEGAAVTPAVVQGIRDWNQAKRDGWTEAELLKVK